MDIYLSSGQKITVTVTLGNAAPYSVLTETAPTEGSSVVITNSSNTSYNNASKFTSADGYTVRENSSNQLELAVSAAPGDDNTGGNTDGDNTGGDNTGGSTGGDNTGGTTGNPSLPTTGTTSPSTGNSNNTASGTDDPTGDTDEPSADNTDNTTDDTSDPLADGTTDPSENAPDNSADPSDGNGAGNVYINAAIGENAPT